MADQINIDEPTATLREVTVAVYDENLDPATGIDESDVTIKIAKAGATSFSASTATLTEITSATDGGLFILRFPQGEVDTRGDLRFEIASGSTQITTVLGYVNIGGPVWDEVLDSAAPANAQTAKEILNLIISGVVAECSNLDSDGGVVFRDTGDTKDRITGSVAAGIRTITTLDGT